MSHTTIVVFTNGVFQLIGLGIHTPEHFYFVRPEQPSPTDPPGGEQPAVNAGSDTFPLDVAAAWTTDRHTLTVVVLNPTDVDQSIQLNIKGANLAGKGTLWRLASTELNGQNPIINGLPVDSKLDKITLSHFSVNIYELPVK